MFSARLITKAFPLIGYAISSSLQSTKGGISSLSDSTSPLSLVSITLRFGHWDAMCPFPKHLKHLISLSRVCWNSDLPIAYFREKLSEATLNDTIQARSNSDFDVKSASIQFYGNNHNSQSDRWIGLQFYVESPDMFSYLGFKFQINRISGRHLNTGQQRMYEFCYLLPFWLVDFLFG